ncbi:MAG: recombinase family protein, partial [Clostridiales bacterium]|nr:recombinase family protein [Clostridiales bacterium]
MSAKKKAKNETAVIYARYSSHNQGEQSIEGQLAAAKAYADAKGYNIIHEYIDRAMTGRNDNRDEFQQMLSDCAKKQFSVIIVWKVDRFGRNREEITFNKYRAKKQGVRVEYVAENIADGPEGVILESVLEGMAEYYSLQLSQNVQRGLYESAKKHHAIGGQIPLGYRVAPDKTFEIDPDTAPVVKMIFEKYAAGETTFEIMHYLNENGYRTSKGKPFTKSSLPTLLKNEKYIGIYVYKDLIRDENAVPAIIEPELFYKVQQMLQTNHRMPSHRWSYSDYLLTDKLFCGYCGSPMSGKSGYNRKKIKYGYYACGTHIKDNTICQKKPVRQDYIENMVLTTIADILQNDELIKFIAESTWRYYLSQDADQERVRALQKQLADVEKGTSNLTRAIEAGVLNESITCRMEELDSQKAAIKKALSEIELKKGLKLTKEHILFFLEEFRKMDLKDRDCQKRLVKTFINAIFLYDDYIKIAFNYGGDTTTISLSDIQSTENTEKATTSGVFDCDGLSWASRIRTGESRSQSPV